MKKVFNLLKVTEKDNGLVAAGKGAIQGTLSASVAISAIGGTLILIGKCITKKEELEKFEREMGA